MRADAAAAAAMLEARAATMASLAVQLRRRVQGTVTTEEDGDGYGGQAHEQRHSGGAGPHTRLQPNTTNINNRERVQAVQLLESLAATAPLLTDTARLLRTAVAATPSSARNVVCGDRDASSGTVPLFLAGASNSPLLKCFGLLHPAPADAGDGGGADQSGGGNGEADSLQSQHREQQFVREAAVEMDAGIRRDGVPAAPASKSKCRKCSATTARVWLTDAVCYACELDAVDRGVCPRDGPACRPAAMCKHQHRCLACQ